MKGILSNNAVQQNPATPANMCRLLYHTYLNQYWCQTDVYFTLLCSKWPLEHAAKVWLDCRTLCNSWPVLHEYNWQKEMEWYNKCNIEHKLHCGFFLKARPSIYQQYRPVPGSKEQDKGMCELYISGLHCYKYAKVFSFLLLSKDKEFMHSFLLQCNTFVPICT